MAVISGDEKEKLITLFKDRGVKFYHACQYLDFKTYVKLGGLPSRNLMQKSGLPYTQFDTDDRDQENSVWNMVFGNLIDSGLPFARFGSNDELVATPNVFGPILLIFEPEIFSEVENVAICLRSAGGEDFNRNNESLTTVKEVNLIFVHEEIEKAPYEQAKAYVKFNSELKKTFGHPKPGSPEVSCEVKDELLSFKYLNKIVVDKYVVNENELHRHVKEIKRNNNLTCSVTRRNYAEGRVELKQQNADRLFNKYGSLEEIINDETAPKELRSWLKRIQEIGHSFFYDRFARYLTPSTLVELSKEKKLQDDIFNFDFD